MSAIRITFAVTCLCLVAIVSGRNSTHRPCHAYSRVCGWTNEVCCNGTCQVNCLGKRCRRRYQCGNGLKCCAGKCQQSCEGIRCHSNRQCVGLQCCQKVCKKNCLGSACRLSYPQCGHYNRRRLECCGGQCRRSCEGQACELNTDCGGYGYRRTSCCNGQCQKSCRGAPCYHIDECRDVGRRKYLACCGFFDEKTCQPTCRNQNCSLDDDCLDGRRRRYPLRCCGNEKCWPSCEGSVCTSDTHDTDCRGTAKMYCCGMGSDKRCRNGCQNLPCKTNADCGRTNFYCRLSKCTTTTNPHENIYIPT